MEIHTSFLGCFIRFTEILKAEVMNHTQSSVHCEWTGTGRKRFYYSCDEVSAVAVKYL